MKKFRPHANTAAARALVALVALGAVDVAAAQDEDDEAEITIRLMGTADAERPEAVTEQIVLPPAAREDTAAVENARRGGEHGNDDRENGREHGLATADEARERGAEMSEEARENAENRGRSEERPDPPGRPDDPGPPDNPGPPD